MRTCDALGVTKLLLVAPQDGLLPGNKHHGATENAQVSTRTDGIGCRDDEIFSGEILRRCSASANFWVETQVFDTVAECAGFLDAMCVTSYGTVLRAESRQLWDTVFQLDGVGDNGVAVNKVALWFGTEVSGLSEAAVRYCERHVCVPMRGMVESLNLSVCVGMVAGEVVRQRLAFVRAEGGTPRTTSLPAEDQAAWVARMSARAGKRRRRREGLGSAGADADVHLAGKN